MNSEIVIRSSLETHPIVIQALMANCSGVTQISQNIATKLNLTTTRDVYVKYSDHSNVIMKWKVSLQPIYVCNNNYKRNSNSNTKSILVAIQSLILTMPFMKLLLVPIVLRYLELWIIL